MSQIRCVVVLFVAVLIGCAFEPNRTPVSGTSRVTQERTAAVPATPSLSAPLISPTRTRTTANRTPNSTPALAGRFTFAPGDGSIWVQELPDGRAHAVVARSEQLFADAPSFSPDGNSILYVQSKLEPNGDVHSSIHSIAVDGKNDRVVASAPDPQTGFNYPIYSPDGRWIYYSYTYPISQDVRGFAVERIPSAGGSAERIVKEGELETLSTDAKRLAFLKFNPDTYSSALWIADADGRSPKQLMGDDVFSTIAAPRFSPDGNWILFAASGPPTRPLPTGQLIPKQPCEPQLLCLFAAPARANGLPWDLWLVSVDGAHYRQLTNIGGDSPWPAWSRDGSTIAFLDTGGIYLVDPNTRTLSKLNQNGGHGVFDWWMPGSK